MSHEKARCLSPIPAEPALPLHAFPRDAHGAFAAIRAGHFWFENRRRALKSVMDSLELPENAKVLEVGCGDGHLLTALPGRLRVGLDLSVDELGQARRGGFDLVVAGSALRLPFRSRFSMVCLFDVIEHVADDIGLLRECASILEPGGWIVLTTPASPRLWSHLDSYAGHYRRYRRKDLRGIFAESGLVLRELFPLFRSLWPLAWANARLGRGRTVADAAQEFSVGTLANGVLHGILGLEWRLLGSSPLGWGTSWCAVASRPD